MTTYFGHIQIDADDYFIYCPDRMATDDWHIKCKYSSARGTYNYTPYAESPIIEAYYVSAEDVVQSVLLLF